MTRPKSYIPKPIGRPNRSGISIKELGRNEYQRRWRAKRPKRKVKYANQPGMERLKSDPVLYHRAFVRLTRGGKIDDLIEIMNQRNQP